MDKPVNKKPKLKKQEILPKRVGGIYEKIYEYENIKTAIKAVCSSPNATKSKKNEKTNAKQQKEKYLGGYRQIHENNTGTSDRRQI